VSDEAKNLISAMLTVDIDKRMTAGDALKHPWISGMTDDDLMKHDLHGTLDEIKKFNARRKLKGTIKAVMAATKMKLLLASLTKASKKVETDNAEEEAAAAAAAPGGEGGGEAAAAAEPSE
jgi:calcium/calmodulin-dependent protein kinase (CaM kinase) II